MWHLPTKSLFLKGFLEKPTFITKLSKEYSDKKANYQDIGKPCKLLHINGHPSVYFIVKKGAVCIRWEHQRAALIKKDIHYKGDVGQSIISNKPQLLLVSEICWAFFNSSYTFFHSPNLSSSIISRSYWFKSHLVTLSF